MNIDLSGWAAVTALALFFLSIVVVFLATLKKGWLPNISSDIFSIMWNDNRKELTTKDDDLAFIDSSPPLRPRRLIDYDIDFSEHSLQNLYDFRLSKADLLDLINHEFANHANYLIFDLEDYILPAQKKYLIHINKIGNKLNIKAVYRCTRDQARLAAWEDILLVYRRICRLNYRKPGYDGILDERQSSHVQSMLKELLRRLGVYFRDFDGIRIHRDGMLAIGSMDEIINETNIEDIMEAMKLYTDNAKLSAEIRDQLIQRNYQSILINNYVERINRNEDMRCLADKANTLYFMVSQAYTALWHSEEAKKEHDIYLVNDISYNQQLICNFERCLQFIHKAINEFPPSKKSDSDP